jgi:hypothetical protein
MDSSPHLSTHQNPSTNSEAFKLHITSPGPYKYLQIKMNAPLGVPKPGPPPFTPKKPKKGGLGEEDGGHLVELPGVGRGPPLPSSKTVVIVGLEFSGRPVSAYQANTCKFNPLILAAPTSSLAPFLLPSLLSLLYPFALLLPSSSAVLTLRPGNTNPSALSLLTHCLKFPSVVSFLVSDELKRATARFVLSLPGHLLASPSPSSHQQQMNKILTKVLRAEPSIADEVLGDTLANPPLSSTSSFAAFSQFLEMLCR